MSSSDVDIELAYAVTSFVRRGGEQPQWLEQNLPSVLERVKTLLARGARPDVLIGTQEQSTSCLWVFCLGCRQGMEPLLELLLAADYKPALDLAAASHLPSGCRYTPLCAAIDQLLPSFVRLLIAHGADVKAPCTVSPRGRLDWPVRVCVTNIWTQLTENRNVDGALETLDHLISAGADLDAVDDRWIDDEPPGQRALLIALRRLELQPSARAVLDAVAMRLLDAGANVHARNYSQMRPLNLASFLPSLDVFKALVAKGADPSPVPFIVEAGPGALLMQPGQQLGTHYLQIAVQEGRADVLQAAAAAGVKLKKVKLLGEIAVPLLVRAVVEGQLSCVRCLLDCGVDVNEVCSQGEYPATAVDLAQCQLVRRANDSWSQVIAALRAAGGKGYDEL